MFHGDLPPEPVRVNLIERNQHSVVCSKFANYMGPNFIMGEEEYVKVFFGVWIEIYTL